MHAERTALTVIRGRNRPAHHACAQHALSDGSPPRMPAHWPRRRLVACAAAVDLPAARVFDGYGQHLEWPRNAVIKGTALLKTLASVLALSFSVGGGNVLAASDWNVRVVKVETGRSVPALGGKGLWISDETMSDVFYVGELIEVFCRYE